MAAAASGSMGASTWRQTGHVPDCRKREKKNRSFVQFEFHSSEELKFMIYNVFHVLMTNSTVSNRIGQFTEAKRYDTTSDESFLFFKKKETPAIYNRNPARWVHLQKRSGNLI